MSASPPSPPLLLVRLSIPRAIPRGCPAGDVVARPTARPRTCSCRFLLCHPSPPLMESLSPY